MERSLLSSILWNPAIFEDLSEKIKESDFYLPAHKYIYEAMGECEKKDLPIDSEFIEKILKKEERFDEDAMLEIQATNPLPSTKAYVQELVEKAQKRDLIVLINEMREKIEQGEDVDIIKQHVIDRAENIGLETQDDVKDFDEFKKEYLSAPPPTLIKAHIGFIDQPLSLKNSDFDWTRDGGFQTGGLTLLMGDPEAGKTALAVQIIKNVTKDEPVLFMPYEFTVGNFVETQLRIEGDDYSNKNLKISIVGEDIKQIIKKLRIWRKKGVRLAVIDSQMRVTNVSSKGGTSEEKETEKFTALARAAQKLDMHIIFICQQGKEDARGGVISPMKSKLGGHEATIILYLKKEKDSEDRELLFSKNKQTGKHFKKALSFERTTLTFRAIRKETDKGKSDEVPLSEAEQYNKNNKVPVEIVYPKQQKMELE